MVEDIFKVEEAEVTLTKDGRVRKRRPKKSIDYFTLDTQQAILDYRLETSQAKRNQIFNEKIYFCIVKIYINIPNLLQWRSAIENFFNIFNIKINFF